MKIEIWKKKNSEIEQIIVQRALISFINYLQNGLYFYYSVCLHFGSTVEEENYCMLRQMHADLFDFMIMEQSTVQKTLAYNVIYMFIM